MDFGSIRIFEIIHGQIMNNNLFFHILHQNSLLFEKMSLRNKDVVVDKVFPKIFLKIVKTQFKFLSSYMIHIRLKD